MPVMNDIVGDLNISINIDWENVCVKNSKFKEDILTFAFL